MTNALTSEQLEHLRDEALAYLRLSANDPQFTADAISLYLYDPLSNNSAASVEIIGGSNPTMFLRSSDQASVEGISSIALTAHSTLESLVTEINATPGKGSGSSWIATIIGSTDRNPENLAQHVEASALGLEDEELLQIYDQKLIDSTVERSYWGLCDYIGRNLYVGTYIEREYFDTWYHRVVLNQPDVQRVLRVGIDVQGAMQIAYDGSDLRATAEVTDTALILRSEGATVTETILLFSDHATITDLGGAAIAVDGWQVAVNQFDLPSNALVRQPALNCHYATMTLDAWLDWEGDYECDYKSGTLRMYQTLTPPRALVSVEYIAGFDTLPRGVEGVLMKAIKAEWDATQLTAGVVSERLGDYSYSRSPGVSVGAADRVFQDSETILGDYRRWTP